MSVNTAFIYILEDASTFGFGSQIVLVDGFEQKSDALISL